MPARRDDLTWVDLSDFSPGIVDPLYAHGSSAFGPLGSARDCQGCLPTPTGGLRPGWRLMEIRSDPSNFNAYTPSRRPADFPRTWLTSTGILTPVESHTNPPMSAGARLTVASAVGAVTVTVDSTSGFTVGETITILDTGVPTHTETRVLTAKTATTFTWVGGLTYAYPVTVTVFSVKIAITSSSEVDAATPDIVSMQYMDFWAPNNDSMYKPHVTMAIYDLSQTPVFYNFHTDVIDIMVLGTDWRRVGGATAVGLSGTPSSDLAPPPYTWSVKIEDLRTFISTVCWFEGASAQGDITWPDPIGLEYRLGQFKEDLHTTWRTLTYHDNRAVGIPRRPQGSGPVTVQIGARTASLSANLSIEFTGVAEGVAPRLNHLANYPTNPKPTDGSERLIVDFQANPACQLVSINGVTLLVVCNQIGGYLIRGSVEKAQTTKLAAIPPFRGRVSVPVVAPPGIVYGTRDGVYAVQEDGSSQSLSTNLSPEFWVPPDAPAIFNRLDAVGKFNYVHQYLLAPNNHLMQLDSGSWWRPSVVPAVAPYSSYEVSATGQVYAFPSYRTETEHTAWHRYDPNLQMLGDSLVHSYTWSSNGIRELTPDTREINIRAIEVTGSGYGTVRVDITAGPEISGSSVSSKTFTFASDVPVTIRTYISTTNKIAGGLTATTLDLTVNGDGTSRVLPRVDGVAVGIAKGSSGATA